MKYRLTKLGIEMNYLLRKALRDLLHTPGILQALANEVKRTEETEGLLGNKTEASRIAAIIWSKQIIAEKDETNLALGTCLSITIEGDSK